MHKKSAFIAEGVPKLISQLNKIKYTKSKNGVLA
jgi:hypothetical protein